MAKLIVLALAFTALVAFASAHTTTIVTTTIGDDNPISRQCSPRIQRESFNQCVRYLQQGQQQQGGRQQYQGGQQQQQGGQQQHSVQQCCQELQRVDPQCQCEAVQQVFQKVQGQQQQQQGQQGGRYGSQQLQGLKMKAQNIPNQCNLQVRQCPIRTIISTTTITNPFIPVWPFGSRQQCSRSEVQGRSFNQCQRYIEEQISGISPRTLLMSINRRGQGQSRQDVQQCCNELQNVRRECQCEAVKEVYRQTTQQMQQGGRRQQQQGGGQQQEMMSIVHSVVQNLPNECNLQVQQCQIPSSMF